MPTARNEMRDRGVRGLLIYCSDYKCSRLVTISGDRWVDDVRPPDLELRFICSACGKRGADMRPDFNRRTDGCGKKPPLWPPCTGQNPPMQ
jgi:hypothetical protein